MVLSLFHHNFAEMKLKADYYSSPKGEPNLIEIDIETDGLRFAKFQSESQFWNIDDIVIEKLQGAEKWMLLNHQLPNHSILIDNPFVFFEIKKAFPKALKKVQQGDSSRSKSISFALAFLLFSGVFLVLFFWKGAPIISDFIANSVPQKYENKLGEQLIKQVLAEEKVNQKKTALIRKFYGRLLPLKNEEGTRSPIEITVVDKDAFNAFAIPGRKIVVYSGVFKSIQTYPELMALLGHEAGHVEERHSIRTLARSMSTYAILSFFLGDISGIMGILIQNAESIYSMSYSRDFERKSDLLSHEFLCLNRTDPNGVVRLMTSMKKEVGNLESKELSFLSSHPLTEERIESAKKQIELNPCQISAPDSSLQDIFAQLKAVD